MKLIPGRGIADKILFGMKSSEIIKILGGPDVQRTLDKEFFIEEIEYEYFKEKLSLAFYNEDEVLRLSWIETENPCAVLFNKKIIGLKEDDAVKLLKENGLKNYSVEEFDKFKTLLFDEFWIELDVVYGCISRIKFGVLLGDEEEYLWIK